MKKYLFLIIGLALGATFFLATPQASQAATGCCLQAGECNRDVQETDCPADAFDPACGWPECQDDQSAGSGCCYYASLGTCSSGVSETDCSANNGLFDSDCTTLPGCASQSSDNETSDEPVSSFKPADICGTAAVKNYGQPSGLLTGMSEVCYACGACGLCDFLQVANNVARWIFGIMGGVAFIMFLWGGTGWIMSFGNSEKIEGSKKVLTSALFGLAIILLAWQIVYVLIFIFAGGKVANVGLFPSSTKQSYFWYNPCELKKGAGTDTTAK